MIEFQHLQICGGIVLVNVGRQNIQRGRRDFPDGEHIVGGAAALVGAGSARQERVAQRRVGVQRQRINGLARGGHLPYIFRHRPGVEENLGFGTKGFLPVRGWRSGLHMHGAEHLRRNRRFKELLCGRGEIAKASQLPASFSTWTMMTVRCGSASLRCRMKAANGSFVRFERGGGVGRRRVYSLPVLSTMCG